MQQKYNFSVVDLEILEELIHLEQPFKAGMPWQFAGSFYYSTTVLTTIGTEDGAAFASLFFSSFRRRSLGNPRESLNRLPSLRETFEVQQGLIKLMPSYSFF